MSVVAVLLRCERGAARGVAGGGAVGRDDGRNEVERDGAGREEVERDEVDVPATPLRSRPERAAGVAGCGSASGTASTSEGAASLGTKSSSSK